MCAAAISRLVSFISFHPALEWLAEPRKNLAYRKASLSGAKRKAKESAKKADLAVLAKGLASAGE
jgi:hypothetical protein